jgi:hypothetical protein
LRTQSRTERWVAIGLIVVFLVLVTVLIQMRSDQNWDRLVYLLGGVEALVFAGAGALFGTSVHRGQLADALESADQERGRADRETEVAARGRAVSAAIRTKAQIRQRRRAAGKAGDPGGDRGARPLPGADNDQTSEDIQDSDADLLELAALCEELLPTEHRRS